MGLAEQVTLGFQRVAAEIKAYRSATAPMMMGNARIGWWIPHSHALTYGAAVMQNGFAAWGPTDIGPDSITVDAMSVYVSTAGAGTLGTLTIAIYADKADHTGPDLTVGPLRQGTVDLTSVGQKIVTISPLALTRGRYWVASHYYQSTTPTTAPQVYQLTNTLIVASPIGPNTTTNASRALVQNGKTTLPPAGSSDTGMTTSNGTVLAGVWLRRSA